MRYTLLTLLCAVMCFGSAHAQYTYLGSWNSQGVPNYLEGTDDTISRDLLEDVNASLPERRPVPTYNAHYLDDTNDLDLELTQQADVWITFVHEGAGWKNALAFYTYDLASPPATANDITDLTLIFPNFSYQYGGGGLTSGNKVHLGTFDANTGIGFALITRGWNRGSQTVSNNYYTVYSNPDFNPETDPTLRQHCVSLKDNTRDLVLIGFEDINREWGGCDNDFNDAIFYATANPYSAIDNENRPVVYDTDIDCNSVPENLMATDIGLYKATLSWDDFNEADSYRIRFREWGTDDDWEYRNASGNTSITLGSILYDHLQPGTWYEWQAATTCSGTQTSNSVKHVFKTLTPCEMPTGNAATNITDDGARVSWTAVLDAEEYVMRYRKLGETDYEWRNVGTNTYFDISGLDPSSTYEWGVSATCSDLESCIAPYLSNYTFVTSEEGRASDGEEEVCVEDVNTIVMEVVTSKSSSIANKVMIKGDVNGDGMEDVIAYAQNGGTQIEVFMQTNPVTMNISSAQTITFPHHFTNITTGDIDGDDKLDLLLTDQHQNQIHFFRNASIGDNAVFDKMYSHATDLLPSTALLVDLEGDEEAELALAFEGTDQIKLYKKGFTNADGKREPNAWEHYKQFVTGEAPGLIKSADIDQNGKQDLMVLNDLNEHFTLVYNGNEADSTYYIRSIYKSGPLTKQAIIGDINGDGKLDMVALSYQDQTMTIYQNIGTPGNMMLEESQVIELSGTPFEAAIGDFNGDQLADIALTYSDLNSVSIFQSLSTEMSVVSSPNHLNLGYPGGSIAAVEMNGDEVMELIVSGLEDGGVTVLGSDAPNPFADVEIAQVKSKSLSYAAETEIPVADWIWELREGNIWIDANDIKGVKNADSRKVSLDSDIPQTYNAIRVKIRDRNCNHVYISAPKNLSMVPEQLAQLSPNPATEMVQFTLMDGMAEQVSVEVISPTGQKVYELNKQEIDGTFNTYIDVSQWAVGCYYLRVVTNNGSSIEKLVVQ